MNYETIMRRAVIPGVIAAAAISVFLVTHLSASVFVGFASVAIVAGVVVLEYRLSWKWLSGRLAFESRSNWKSWLGR
jgi:Flp pilus assembly pilin Flp